MGSGEIKELAADKGYHSNGVLVRLKEEDVRSYVSEPERGRRRWKGKRVAQKAVYGNRRRLRGEREQAAPVQARRVERTKFRSHVRDRRHETPPLERPTEHPETAARPRWPASTCRSSCACASVLASPGSSRAAWALSSLHYPSLDGHFERAQLRQRTSMGLLPLPSATAHRLHSYSLRPASPHELQFCHGLLGPTGPPGAK